MSTLKDYLTRGIDITLMTSEQLIEDGYITPLNELSILITEPGDYKIRNGKRVTIHGIKPTHTLATTAFTAQGSVWKKPTNMGLNPEYEIWHVSGRCFGHKESPRDILTKWSA
jgi:hypothetical protein